MGGASDWLAKRYGGLLFALLLTGAWADVTKVAGYIRARRRFKRVRLNPLYNMWECGRIVPTPLGLLYGMVSRARAKLKTRVRLAKTAGLAALRSLAHASREEVEKVLDQVLDESMKRSHLITYYDAPFERYRRLYGWTEEDVKRLLRDGIMGAVAYVWDNGGADGLWTTGANWSPDAPAGGPVAGDTVTYNVTSVANCSINTAAACTSVTIAAGYTGIVSISAGNSLTTSGAFTINTATFTTNNNAVAIGSWTQGGGTVNCGSSTITNSGAYTHSAGTFNNGTSTWVVAGGGGAYGGASFIALAEAMTGEFYNVTVDAGATMTCPVANSNIAANGLTLNGTVAQNGGASYSQFNIASGSTLNVGANGTFSGIGQVIVASNGSFSFQGGSHSINVLRLLMLGDNNITITLTANLTNTGAGWAFYPALGVGAWNLGRVTNCTLNCNGFSLSLPNAALCIGGPDRISIPDTQTGAILFGSGTHSIRYFTLAGGALGIKYADMGSGSITVTGGTNANTGYCWIEQSTSASWVVGTETVTFTGASPPWLQSSASDHIYNYRFNGTGTIVTTATVFRCANQLRVSAGTLTPSIAITNAASYLVDGGTLTWNNAAHFQAPVTASSGTLNFTVGDTMTGAQVYSGATVSIAANAIVYSSTVNVSGSTVTFTTGSATCNADFTMTSGTFGSNSNYTLDWNSTVNVTGGTFNAPSGNLWTANGASITFRPDTFNHDLGRFVLDRAGDQTVFVRSTAIFDEVESLGGGTKTFDCGCTINTEIETAGTITILSCGGGSPSGAALILLSEEGLLDERKRRLPHEYQTYKGCC